MYILNFMFTENVCDTNTQKVVNQLNLKIKYSSYFGAIDLRLLYNFKKIFFFIYTSFYPFNTLITKVKLHTLCYALSATCLEFVWKIYQKWINFGSYCSTITFLLHINKLCVRMTLYYIKHNICIPLLP